MFNYTNEQLTALAVLWACNETLQKTWSFCMPGKGLRKEAKQLESEAWLACQALGISNPHQALGALRRMIKA